MRVIKIISGLIAIMPAILLAGFYSHRFLSGLPSYPLHGSANYQTGIVLLILSFLACLASPIAVGMLFFLKRPSVPRFLVIMAVICAAISFAVIHFDPADCIHAFMAD